MAGNYVGFGQVDLHQTHAQTHTLPIQVRCQPMGWSADLVHQPKKKQVYQRRHGVAPVLRAIVILIPGVVPSEESRCSCLRHGVALSRVDR
jgi:hypothetical protein